MRKQNLAQNLDNSLINSAAEMPSLVPSNQDHQKIVPMIAPKLKDLVLPFGEDDIEWRVQRSGLAHGRPWALVLAYVDARAVQNRLDDVVGPENWTVQYHHIPGGVMCDLSIRCDREWVTKSDGSPETNIEAFKGGISKSLVRAASVWGIGRYLYRLSDKFATFVDKRTPGAREVRVDDKYFYWVPPELPAWALPEGQAPRSRIALTAEAVVNGQSTESQAKFDAEGQEASTTATATSYFKPEEDTFNGGYVVMFGRKHFGKKISDIPVEELEKYRGWLIDDSKKSGKPLSDRAQEFLMASEAYLNNFKTEQTVDRSEEIPF